MHGSHITAGLLVLAALGCGDDPPRPTISDATGWQLSCDPASNDCRGTTSHGAHRNREDEDIAIKVSCSQRENGLRLVLTDPGADPPTATRRASTITIERLDPELNRCTITVEESTSTGPLFVVGHCDGPNVSCQIVDGERDSNGWAFDGTIRCDGMNYRNVTAGRGPFSLRAPGMPGEPMVLQIANCD